MGFAKFTPMELKSDAHLSLTNFIQDIGVMETLLVDNAPTMAYKEWQKTVREYRINQRMTEPYSPWQNRAELDVREIKRAPSLCHLRCLSPVGVRLS
jgi:transposase InsO family protein